MPEQTVGAPAVSTPMSMRAVVAQVLGRALGRPALRRDEAFFDVGGGSQQAAAALAELRALTGLDLSSQTLQEHATPSRLAAYLESHPIQGSRFTLAGEFVFDAAAGPRSPLAPNALLLGAAANAHTVLVCIHPGDGGASMYAPLLHSMRQRPPVVLFTAWDSSLLRPPAQNLHAIASDYARQLRTIAPSGTFQLVGWSSGAAVAYEMGIELKAENRVLGPVLMIDPFLCHPLDIGAARVPAPDDPHDSEDLRVALPMFAMQACLPLDDSSFWHGGHERRRFEAVCRQARAKGYLPAKMGPTSLARLCRYVRHHCAAQDLYQQPRIGDLDLAFVVPRIRSSDDRAVATFSQAARGRKLSQEVGGHHLSMMRAPHVQQIATLLDQLVRPSEVRAFNPVGAVP